MIMNRRKFIHLLVLAAFLLSFLPPASSAVMPDVAAGHSQGMDHGDTPGHDGPDQDPTEHPRLDCDHGCDYCVAAGCQPPQAASLAGAFLCHEQPAAPFYFTLAGLKPAHTERLERPPCS